MGGGENRLAGRPPRGGRSFDADAWFASIYGDYSTKEDYLYWNGSTEEDFQQEMLDEYIAFQLYQEERRTTVEAYETRPTPALWPPLTPMPGSRPTTALTIIPKRSIWSFMAWRPRRTFSWTCSMSMSPACWEADNRRQRVEAYEASHPGALPPLTPTPGLPSIIPTMKKRST